MECRWANRPDDVVLEVDRNTLAPSLFPLLEKDSKKNQITKTKTRCEQPKKKFHSQMKSETRVAELLSNERDSAQPIPFHPVRANRVTSA